jgi:hypothetical protein
VFIQYKQNAERAVYKEIFVNHLYFQVDSCINAIPEEYEDIKASQIEQIINNLNRIETILYDGSSFLDRQINVYDIIYFDDIGNIIHNYYTSKHLRVGSKLNELKENLEVVKLKMSSEKTGQENPRLSTEEINSIFREFLNNYN